LGNDQWLDSERVAGKTKRPRLPIPYRSRIHALGAEPGFVAPAEISRKERLDVASRPERIGTADLVAELKMIDDLAIADDRVASVGTGDRLVPGLDVACQTRSRRRQVGRNRRGRVGPAGRIGG